MDYDVQARARAGSAAIFRAAVSVYIIYLAVRILRGVLDGSSTVPAWIGWLTSLLFIAGAIAFGIYTWKCYRRDLKAAKLPEQQEEDSDDPSA